MDGINAITPQKPYVSIAPLLKRLWPSPEATQVTADEVALAISHVFRGELSPVQVGALLTALHFTGWDRKADVLAKCAAVMREAAAPVDIDALRAIVGGKGVERGEYRGGLCDIVGTGGDNHSTFNVSTTASIVASAEVLVAKHGNRSATSKSGSAEVLASMDPAPDLDYITPETILTAYERTQYAFLFAQVFHPGMKRVATVRKELGWRTIFNLLGPLANPVDPLIEARVVGVARRDLGPVFAEALRIGGAKKAMVVCGEEDLDEISCAGRTFCWRLREVANPDYRDDIVDGDTSDESTPRPTVVAIDHFILSPADFGLPAHPLCDVAPGKSPRENAVLLKKLITNQLDADDPVLHFVLLNAAALLDVTGACEGDVGGDTIEERGPGGGRWKEGIRRARLAIESGACLRSWQGFVGLGRDI
ncbi:MAG: anthranilate phosphoribosyltransferase [Lichina confinis]|nr:MAG: anthranilate phosphoribosyltransferase [Lichina confinis]